MSADIPVPPEEPPWNGEGPPPEVTTWPPGRQPAVHIWDGTHWRYAPVQARHTYPDRVVYQVLAPVEGGARTTRFYRWGQPGIRPAHGPAAPSAGSGHIDSADA